MEGLLTPVSSFRANEKRDETRAAQQATGIALHGTTRVNSNHSSVKSPEDALEVLRHEPDYKSLVSVLRFLSPGKSDSEVFNIARPGPTSARLVQVLVSEIVPNYWALLKEDSHGGKASPLRLLLGCLHSITGINSILVRLRALMQEAKSETKEPKRPDISLNLGILLDVLCLVFKGDGSVCEIWKLATATLESEAKTRPLAQELVTLFGSGKIVSLSAEAAELLKDKKTQTNPDDIWPADSLRYTEWLGRNLVKWLTSDSAVGQAKVCSDLFAKSLQLGHSGKTNNACLYDIRFGTYFPELTYSRATS